jgi:F-type H+-transporting ATPase subunit epsilon
VSESLVLEIVTPTGVALRADAREVTAPGLGGEFGVLPGHLPMLVALRTGLVRFAGPEGDQEVAVAHGFCEVASGKVIVLAENFRRRDDVDVLSVRSRLKDVDAEIDGWTGELDDPKRRALIEEEQWLATQLELVGDPPPPTIREDTRFLDDPEEELAPEEAASAEEASTDDEADSAH